MINYTWDCRTVDVYPTKGELEKVVYNVHWRLTGTDENGISETIIGTQLLDTENITSFIPTEELTNEQITKWVEESIGEEQIDNYKMGISKRIDYKVNPTSITITIEN